MDIEFHHAKISDIKDRAKAGKLKVEDINELLALTAKMTTLDYIAARITQMTKELEENKTFPVIEDLGRHFMKVKTLDETLRELAKPTGALLNRLKISVVPEALRDLGTTSIKLVNLGIQLVISQTTSAKMLDKDACIAWLKENDLPDIVQEQVNHQTLGSLARSFAEEGKDLPEELFEVRSMDNTSVRKL